MVSATVDLVISTFVDWPWVTDGLGAGHKTLNVRNRVDLSRSPPRVEVL